MKNIKGSGDSGFTLIELLVVIVILGLLAAVIAPNILGRADDAKFTKAITDIQALGTALSMYKLDNGIYPDTEQGLQALIEAPTSGTLPRKWRKGGYLQARTIQKDPWHNDYVYICPGAHGDFDISAYGGDGMVGGEDNNRDVNSWDTE